MRKFRTLLLASAMAVGFGAAAEAAPITGMINFAGLGSYTTTTLTITTAFVTGPNTGSFAVFPMFTPATWTSPLTFSPAISPTGLIWSVTSGGNTATFSATSGSGSVTGPFLNISMNGVLTMTGFDPTPGKLLVSSQGGTGFLVSFSATSMANVPEPATLGLLGAGLLGLGYALRRRRAA